MSNTIGPPPTGVGWDEDYPDVSDAHGNGAYEIRDLRKGLRIRVSKEHVTLAGSSAGGEHKQGSAVTWIQDDEPTTRPDGSTALTSADLGRIWYDTTNYCLKELTAIGSPNTWTPFGEILLGLYSGGGDEPDRGLYMKGNELYFKGQDGTEKQVGGLIDEDDMSSDSATRCPSQQSVKAFVATQDATYEATAEAYADAVGDAAVIEAGGYTDTEIASISDFGAYQTDDADSATLAKDVVYQAQHAGLVVASVSGTGSSARIYGYTSASASSPSLRLQQGRDEYQQFAAITLPVRSGEYWKVAVESGTPTIYFVPLFGGTSKCTK